MAKKAARRIDHTERTDARVRPRGAVPRRLAAECIARDVSKEAFRSTTYRLVQRVSKARKEERAAFLTILSTKAMSSAIRERFEAGA